MTRLRIAIVGHIRHPVARPFMGGMEAFTWRLARSLAHRGHDVHLLASGDSEADAPDGVTVHPVIDTHYDRDFPWHRFHGTDALNDHLDQAFARAGRMLIEGGFDVVHNNSLHRYIPRLARTHKLPMVSSLHIPPFRVLADAMADGQCPWHIQTVTSARQARIWWGMIRPAKAQVVHNGIDLDDWPYHAGGDGSAVWSGRITPNKGTHLAVQAARLANVPLRICGVIEHEDYFNSAVRPYLSDRITYLGHLSGTELATIYADASCMLFTPQWEEPFGLAAVEAMATGLPVAATDYGAVREVLGPAGAVATSDTASALAVALVRALQIDPQTARNRAVDCFGMDRMIAHFEGLYHEAQASTGLPARSVQFSQNQLQIAAPDAGPTREPADVLTGLPMSPPGATTPQSGVQERII
ncbi:glycosyltransferase [Pseudooctadecabacter sp.]|uniref:glycosyltransferase n=1 Tax=Pseudooctadecabacter sp. TaxID=1966338 RepID=UPI0025F75900|nr:glycosyltransferase [Pseudooctadecabacter sp.]